MPGAAPPEVSPPRPRTALALTVPGVTSGDRLASPADGAAGPRPRGGRDPEAGLRRVGDEVAEDVRRALAFVLRSTSARPQTEAEVRGRLAERGVDDAVAGEAIAHAKRLKAIDDVALASAWVADRGLRGGYGRARLRAELRRRQVDDQVVEDALAALDERDDLAAATELARKRVRQLPAGLAPEAVARRLAGYLARRGHPPALAQQVAAEVSGLRRAWD